MNEMIVFNNPEFGSVRTVCIDGEPWLVGKDVAEILDNKAEIDGYYEDLTAGSSEQLLSNTYIPDTDPYLFRTTAGSKEVGDRVYEDAIVGGSVAWNQLVQNGDFESSSGWSRFNTSKISAIIANGLS